MQLCILFKSLTYFKCPEGLLLLLPHSAAADASTTTTTTTTTNGDDDDDDDDDDDRWWHRLNAAFLRNSFKTHLSVAKTVNI
jgi:hypothetical protein